MGKGVRSALASKIVLLDRMKNVSAFVKNVLDLGKDVSEVCLPWMPIDEADSPQLNDVAKAVFGLADKLFKVRSLSCMIASYVYVI